VTRLLATSLLLAAFPCMAADAQKVTPPTPSDLERLSAQRARVEKYLVDDASRKNYATAPGKLGLLRALIEQRVFKPTQTYELQCMGVVLGDALVQQLKLEWVMVEDSSGRDPAVRAPKRSIIVFPLTMISKRIERGEAVDVFALFNRVADDIERLKKEAD